MLTTTSTFLVVQQFLSKSTLWSRQFDRPQEVGCFLEVWTSSEYFVYQIFDTYNTVFA
eukprot:NODE_2389_length_614_cov_213.031858_g2032_i0.p2 GENE.NODE_2389_length_614_cov_213.031858_g2032_i0~~NODE_2389_length_614_cov_213.031858_g2032_i0.p2  ORF type:complete len:58 (+),score=1.63 NODE_2389_length_614_cov_213.031858_g2032_i0:172-345(+)